MTVDCHNHPDWLGMDFGRFLNNMDGNGIGVTWLMSWECPSDEYDPGYLSVMPETGPGGPIPLSRCVSYAEKAPHRFVLGYAPDPRRPEAVDRLKYAVDTYGVRICGELKLRMTYDNPDALRLFRACGGMGLPVVVHIDYEFDTGGKYPRPNWWYGGGIEALERALKACPQTNFIGHAPGFWAHISGDGKFDKEPYPSGNVEPGGTLITLLGAHRNLYCDISANSGLNALSRDPGFARRFLQEYSDRVLFGRDCFSNAHREFLDGLGLPEPVLAKIYGENALRLVPL